MVFQSYALYPQMTVEGNLSFGLRDRRRCRRTRSTSASRAPPRSCRSSRCSSASPSQLSGGQRQRVAIGRALVRDVDVFLFDEPLSNLDAKLRSELRVEIKRLHQQLDNTMIYVTHDQIEAMTLADRIAVMKGGVIQQLDAPHDDLQPPGQPLRRRLHRLAGDEFHRRQAADRGGCRRFAPTDVDVPLAALQLRQRRRRRRAPAVLGIRPEHIALRRAARATAVLGRGRGRDRRADGLRHAGLDQARRARTSPSASTPSSSPQRRRHGRRSASIRRAPRCSTRDRQTGSRSASTIRKHQTTDRRTMNWSFQLYSARNFQPWDKVLKTARPSSATSRSKAMAASMTIPQALRDELDKNGLAMPTGAFLASTRWRTISTACARSPTRSASS